MVDESAIIGESQECVKKGTEEEGANPFLLSGSVVKEGKGLMLVCNVGRNSNLMCS